MTVCNMAIEGGARAGLIAPDEKTFDYVKGRPHAPKGAQWEAALAWWKTLHSDDDAHWDKVVTIRGEDIAPVVTWGTSPEDVLPITGAVPAPEDFEGGKVSAAKRSLDYMGLTPGTPLSEIEIDTVFIGSCTNGRIEDLRAAAEILKGKKIKDGLRAMVVPGSGLVRAQAEEEGLADIFREAGLRVAACGLFHVPCDEPRPARARRTLRLEPELRTATSRPADVRRATGAGAFARIETEQAAHAPGAHHGREATRDRQAVTPGPIAVDRTMIAVATDRTEPR
jgi:hypothetical protein